jgi:glycosyltransferase 2 family protein
MRVRLEAVPRLRTRPRAGENRVKNKLSTLIRIVVSFGLLGGLFWIMRDKLSDIWATIIQCDPVYALFAAIFLTVMVWSLSMRLKTVFDGEDLFISFSQAAQLTCVGYFFNNFMPTAVGGDIVKAHYASHFNKKRLKSYASVLMDRLIGMFTVLMIAAVALLVDGGRFEIPIVKKTVIVLIILGAVGVTIATNRSIARFLGGAFMKLKMFGLGQKLNDVYNIVHDYRNRADVVIKSVIFSVIAQSAYYALVYFLFVAMGSPVNIGNIFFIMPVVIFISMLPSIGGLGVREYAIVVFFSVFAGKEISFAVSLMALLGYFIISLAGGVVYMSWGFKPSRDDTSAY